jgi:hypothetical protein
MAFLDSLIDTNFRGDPSGRVVVFPGDRRQRGYAVKSTADELRIKSFLKTFYVAQFLILLLGYFLASEWSRDLSYALGRPAANVLRTIAIVVAIYSLVLGLPYWLLRRSCRNAFLTLVSADDEIALTGKSRGRPWVLGVVLIGLGALMVFVTMLLIRNTSGTH